MERRNTMQKEITYRAVQSFCGHPSADDIYKVISKEHSTISKATVYRNLASLAEEGRIGKVISVDGGETHYDHRIDKHHHAYCIKCGHVADVAVSYSKELEIVAEPMEDGFMLTSHELIFEGICSKCREKEKENDYGTEGIKN